MFAELFILINLLFAILIFYLLIAFLTGAPFVPSTNQTAQIMIKLAKIKQGQTIYDLGSGDGRLLFLTAEKGAKAVGVEINPYLVLFTKIKILFSKQKNNIKVSWKNFWNLNLTAADVVFIYLLPWKMDKLKFLLLRSLRPGALVVSNSFIFPDWQPVRSDPKNHVYVFKIPAKRVNL